MCWVLRLTNSHGLDWEMGVWVGIFGMVFGAEIVGERGGVVVVGLRGGGRVGIGGEEG